jgi:prophage maintenance system killer protein
MTHEAGISAETETVRALELADFLLIAEAVLEVPAKRIAEESSLHLADSALHAPLGSFAGVDFYPDFPTKAAVLCAHLVKNHPLRDGNAPVALVATIEFCLRNGHPWSAPDGDEDGYLTAQRLLDLSAAPITEAVINELAVWIGERIGMPLA